MSARRWRVNVGLDWAEFLVGWTSLRSGEALIVQLHLGPLWVMLSVKLRG